MPTRRWASRAGCRQSADERCGGRGGYDGWEVAVLLATILRTDDAAFEKLDRGDVEQLGDFFADALEGGRIGGDEVGNDLGGFDGEVF